MKKSNEILTEIGERGIWSWCFDLFEIESRLARWAILLAILGLNIYIAVSFNNFIRAVDKQLYGDEDGRNIPSADDTPSFTNRLTVE